MAAGIEHPQGDWLRAAFAGTVEEPAPGLIDPGRATPNQRALSVAIGVAWCRLGRLRGATADRLLDRAAEFYATLAANGHQAVTAAGYGDEQGAPSPHDALWLYWRATMLREARLQGSSALYVLAIREAAEELALCRAFWTPAGVRVPGSRAKQAAGRPFAPHWSTCSWAYAVVMGESMAELDKPDPGPAAIFKDCRQAFLAIADAATKVEPKLHIPVRRWNLESGGFLAALDHDEPMNDRLSWLRVDAGGGILDASDTLADFVVPDRMPDLTVGGGAAGSAPTAPPGSGGAATGAVPGTFDPARLADFAARLSGLRLSRRDSVTRNLLLAKLAAGSTAPELATIADSIANFGIGAGQAQAPAWQSLVADMRGAAR